MSKSVIVPDVASLKDFVGVDLGASDWIHVTQEQIDSFAMATGDQQWIHTDVERAKRESPFGQTIAHGYLTISLVSILMPQIVVIEKCSQIVNYGIDKLRMKDPVPAGSRLRISGVIKGVRMMSNGAARTTLGLRWEVDGARRAVCTGDVIYVFYP